MFIILVLPMEYVEVMIFIKHHATASTVIAYCKGDCEIINHTDVNKYEE